MKKNKIIKIILILFSVILAVLAVIFAVKNRNSDEIENTVKNTEEVYDTEINPVTEAPVPFETVAPAPHTQSGVVTDGWLKILTVGESGDNLCVIAENVSDYDVEYAVLTVSADSEKLSFRITAMPAGKKAVLYCNEKHKYNEDTYYVNWEIADKILYEKPLSLHEDLFEVNPENGSLAVKNISGKDINGDIKIYYKTKDNGVPAGNITHRVSLNGIPANSTSVINSEFVKEDSFELVFIEYDGQ